MIRVCQFCREIYGEKEPLEDKRETHGSCGLCHFLWTIWYALWQEGHVKETASEFILGCRKLFYSKEGSPCSAN